MNFKTCLTVTILMMPSWSQAGCIDCDPPPRIEPKTPTASASSAEESKKVINNADQDRINNKKPPIPEFPGQSGLSDALIQFETSLPSNNSKSCS